MIKLLLKRLGQGALVIFVLQTITFFLVRLLPGNPFLGERKLPEHIMAQLNSLYGLDQSALVQYYNYWKGILTAGDFGPSLVREGVQVADIIAQAFPVSLWLGVLGMGIAIVLGIPAGMLAAYWRNRWPDALFMLLAMAGICIPAFVIAPLFGLTLGLHVPGLSVAGWDDPLCAVLPALTLGLINAAYIARLTRGGMVGVLSADAAPVPSISLIAASRSSPVASSSVGETVVSAERSVNEPSIIPSLPTVTPSPALSPSAACIAASKSSVLSNIAAPFGTLVPP